MTLEEKVSWTARSDRGMRPGAFYQQYYAGVTRDELARRDRTLLIALYASKEINLVPVERGTLVKEERVAEDKKADKDIPVSQKKKRKKRVVIAVSHPEQAPVIVVEEETKNKESMVVPHVEQSPVIIVEEKNNAEAIEIKGVLEKKERASVERPWSKDPVAYCQQQYPGVTRKELKRKNSALYKWLWRRGLLECVPKENKTKEEVHEQLSKIKREKGRFGADALAYYREHYEGTPRGELKEKDSGLYQRLRSDGLLEYVPKIVADFGDDPFAYYVEHHNGWTRGRLKREHKSLYERLRENDLLKNVPL